MVTLAEGYQLSFRLLRLFPHDQAHSTCINVEYTGLVRQPPPPVLDGIESSELVHVVPSRSSMAQAVDYKLRVFYSKA